MANARQFMAARTAAWAKSGGSLPYDAEVEYLQGDGGAYIDTEFNCYGKMPIVEIKTWIEKMSVLQSGEAEFGTWASNDRRFQIYHNSIGIGISQNLLQTEISNYTETWRLDSVEKTGSVTGTYNSTVSGFDISNGFGSDNLYIFSRSGTLDSPKSKMRCFYCKIWDATYLKRDFIPVRFTNSLGVSEGALYDRASGQLFRNAGTGAFIIGPDKT